MKKKKEIAFSVTMTHPSLGEMETSITPWALNIKGASILKLNIYSRDKIGWEILEGTINLDDYRSLKPKSSSHSRK